MNSFHLNELESVRSVFEPVSRPAGEEGGGIAILVDDSVQRRLLEAAATQIDLRASILLEVPAVHDLLQFEVIIAQHETADRIVDLFAGHEQYGEGIHPAIVAVRSSADPLAEAVSGVGTRYDGLLLLPMSTAAVAAQLSLYLYAHRAFARRYQTALEELHLNRRIFRSVTSGISVANATLPDLPLVYVNPAFEVMTGYSLEEVQGQNCRFLQGPEKDQASVTLLREAIRDQREITAIIKNFRKDGTPFWNELSLSPIRNREGVLTHVVGIQTDVTARVEFEAALRESEKLAAVGRLASSIAHEINNPLESVMNLLYLAQREDNTAEARRYMALADRELKRVAQITSQSLRFYKQSTRAQAVLASDLLESVLDLYESRTVNSGVMIERRDRSRISIVCLESEIRQVLNNLVRNALDSMHGQGGTLKIRTRDVTHATSATPGLVVTIADQGTGMATETTANIYKPFFTTKGIAGTGLGLWISSEIVLRHGGSLRVRSSQKPGKSGTVFQLFLPAQGANE